MSRNKDRRVLCLSPDVNDKPMSDFLKNSSQRKAWGFKLAKDSKYYASMEFLRGLKTKVAKSICIASKRSRSSGRVSSSNLTRCRSISDPIDSHRAEALEDCIEFLNSSASLKRSNSVSSNY